MNAHRISTLAIFLTALAAIFFVIPAGTEVIDYGTLSPRDFPSILAWIIAGLAVIQIILPDHGTDSEATQLADVIRVGILFAATAGLVWAMLHIGFLPATILLASVAVNLMRERRPIWLGVSVISVPVLIWFIVTQLLDRNLP